MDFLFSVFRKHICPPVFAAFCILRLWGIFQLPWVLVSGHQAALCLSAAQRSHCPTTKHLSLLLFESCSALPHGKQNLKHPCHCIRSLMARATWTWVRTWRFCSQQSLYGATGGGCPALLLPFLILSCSFPKQGLCPAQCSPDPFHSWGQLAFLD